MTNPQNARTDVAGFHPLVIFRVVVGCMFIFSGYLKLAQPYQNFLFVIQSYHLLPAPLEMVTARVFPWLEYLAGVYALLGLWIRPAMALLWVLNTVFIGALGSALLRGLPIDKCGCFGETFSPSPQAMLALDAVLWALFLVSWKNPQGVAVKSLDRRYESRALPATVSARPKKTSQ